MFPASPTTNLHQNLQLKFATRRDADAARKLGIPLKQQKHIFFTKSQVMAL
jgi:hypothetical protein